MSLYSSLESSSELGDPTFPLTSRILPHASLVEKMDTRRAVDAILNAAVGTNKAQGYTMVSMLLVSDVKVEESRLATLFERLSSLLESVSDEVEGDAFVGMVSNVYEQELTETIERIEKHLNKLVGTATRVLQSRISSPAADTSIKLLRILLTSKSRSLLQPQAATIRKAW